MNATELEGDYPIAEDGNGTASVFPMYEDGGGESISVPVVTSTPVFILAVTGVVLALLLVSLASTLSVLCSVCFCCAPGSGRIGYFHIVVAFCVINSAYFLGKGAMWAVTSARVLELFSPPEEVASARFGSLFGDLLTCLLGTDLLLLAASTLDLLVWHSLRSSRGARSCCRSFLLLLCLLLGLLALLGATLVREEGKRGDGEAYLAPLVLPDERSGLMERDRVITVSCLFLALFGVVPLAVLVLFGVCNCVADGASNRALGPARRVARTIEHRACALGAVLVLVFIVEGILRLSLQLNDLSLMPRDEAAEVAVAVLQLAGDLLFAMLPLLFACGVGSLCSCCYKQTESC